MKVITNDGRAIEIKDSCVIIADDGTTFEIHSTEEHLYVKKTLKDAEDVTIKIVPVCSSTIKLR